VIHCNFKLFLKFLSVLCHIYDTFSKAFVLIFIYTRIQFTLIATCNALTNYKNCNRPTLSLFADRPVVRFKSNQTKTSIITPN